MILGLFGRSKANRMVVAEVYRVLTETARQPLLYGRFNVPDTVMGRFEMLALVMVLFLRRTEKAGPALAALAQDVVDAFFEDIDHAIRELGIGDLGVPKRMKRFAGMFYGRAASYGAALDARDRTMLAAALMRNIHPDGLPETRSPGDFEALADHVILLETVMRSDWSEAALLDGTIEPATHWSAGDRH